MDNSMNEMEGNLFYKWTVNSWPVVCFDLAKQSLSNLWRVVVIISGIFIDLKNFYTPESYVPILWLKGSGVHFFPIDCASVIAWFFLEQGKNSIMSKRDQGTWTVHIGGVAVKFLYF